MGVATELAGRARGVAGAHAQLDFAPLRAGLNKEPVNGPRFFGSTQAEIVAGGLDFSVRIGEERQFGVGGAFMIKRSLPGKGEKADRSRRHWLVVFRSQAQEKGIPGNGPGREDRRGIAMKLKADR